MSSKYILNVMKLNNNCRTSLSFLPIFKLIKGNISGEENSFITSNPQMPMSAAPNLTKVATSKLRTLIRFKFYILLEKVSFLELSSKNASSGFKFILSNNGVKSLRILPFGSAINILFFIFNFS